MIIFTYYFYVVYSSANFQDYQDLGRFLQIILVFSAADLLDRDVPSVFSFFSSVLLWPALPHSSCLQVALSRRLSLISPPRLACTCFAPCPMEPPPPVCRNPGCTYTAAASPSCAWFRFCCPECAWAAGYVPAPTACEYLGCARDASTFPSCAWFRYCGADHAYAARRIQSDFLESIFPSASGAAAAVTPTPPVEAAPVVATAADCAAIRELERSMVAPGSLHLLDARDLASGRAPKRRRAASPRRRLTADERMLLEAAAYLKKFLNPP